MRSHSAGVFFSHLKTNLNQLNLISIDAKSTDFASHGVNLGVNECLVCLWCVGVGSPLSPERTRMLLALRINVLAKGYSGIALDTLHAMIQAFNGELTLPC